LNEETKDGQSVRWYDVGGQSGLAVLAFFLPISIAVGNAGWGIALLFFLIKAVAERKTFSWKKTGLEGPVALYLGVTLLTCLTASSMSVSLKHLDSELLLVIFFLAAQFQDGRQAERHLKVFLAGAAVAAALGVFQSLSGAYWDVLANQLFGPPWIQRLPLSVGRKLSQWNWRSTGFFNHPLTYAEVLLMAFAVFFGRVFSTKRMVGYVLYGLSLTLVTGAVIASQSRGVWIAMAALLFLWSVVKKQRKLFYAILIMGTAGLVAIVTTPKYSDRLESVYMITHPSNAIRLGLWYTAAKNIGKTPVLGVGIGNVHTRVDDRFLVPEPNKDWSELHNIFLQAFAEKGFVGLLAFLYLLYGIGRSLWVPGMKARYAGLFFGFAGLMLAGLTESWYNDSEVVMTLFFLAGCATAIRRSMTEGDHAGVPT